MPTLVRPVFVGRFDPSSASVVRRCRCRSQVPDPRRRRRRRARAPSANCSTSPPIVTDPAWPGCWHGAVSCWTRSPCTAGRRPFGTARSWTSCRPSPAADREPPDPTSRSPWVIESCVRVSATDDLGWGIPFEVLLPALAGRRLSVSYLEVRSVPTTSRRVYPSGRFTRTWGSARSFRSRAAIRLRAAHPEAARRRPASTRPHRRRPARTHPRPDHLSPDHLSPDHPAGVTRDRRHRVRAAIPHRRPATSRDRRPATSRDRPPATSRDPRPATSRDRLPATSRARPQGAPGQPAPGQYGPPPGYGPPARSASRLRHRRAGYGPPQGAPGYGPPAGAPGQYGPRRVPIHRRPAARRSRPLTSPRSASPAGACSARHC